MIIIIITYIYIYIYIYINAFAALRFLGFHLEQKVNKYIQILSKVYCFLARAHFLLADHISQKHTGQIVKTISSYPIRFSTGIVNNKNIFFLLCFFCFANFFSFFFCFSFLFVDFLKQKIYILIRMRLCGQVSDEKFSPGRFSETARLFFSPKDSFSVHLICISNIFHI